MSEKSESVLVRRTNTSNSLTVRESGILLGLLAKLHSSEPPAGLKLDKSATSRAFGVVISFIDASVDEARENLKSLRKRAASGDADAEKEVTAAESALSKIEEFSQKANLAEIRGLLDKAKSKSSAKTKRAAKKVATEAAAAVSDVAAASAASAETAPSPV